MHECSVVEQLVIIASKKAEEAHAAKVMRISLTVGELTGYTEDSIRFYFNLLSKKTILEEAQIDVQYVKPVLLCEKCGKQFVRERFTFDCPDCATPGIMTRTGTEFFIETMEIE